MSEVQDKQHFDFAIIGTGPAGQKAAVQASKAGKSVAIIEQERVVGGACVHRGTIPSKTLRENALQLAKVKHHLQDYNMHLREDMQISTLMGSLDRVLTGHDEYISDQLERNNIQSIHGRAAFVDQHTLEITHLRGKKSQVTADIIIIATGSRPRTPSDIEVDHEHILDSDSILSMIYLPQTLTVLGAGVIACEYASIFATLGVEVTIIDRYPRPLGFLDPDLTDNFEQAFSRLGSRFLGNTNTTSVKWDGISQVVIELDNGEQVKSDKVLFALGRVANVDRLNLDNAGLALTDRGIIPVNQHCQTEVDHIYAVGDVIGPPALASSSMEQGRRASCHALGIPLANTSDMIPMGIYTIPEMSTIGITEQQAIEKFGGALVGKALFGEVARGHISRNENGLLKMVADPNGDKLLGVQIVGEGATELIHIAQMALLSNQSTDVFIENIFNFPTLAEAYRVAALQIAEQRNQRNTEGHT